MEVFLSRRVLPRSGRRALAFLATVPWMLASVSSTAQQTPHLAAAPASPQVPLATSSADATSEVPEVPGLSRLVHGFNAGLTISGIHDAQTGWAVLSEPAVGYSFNEIFSLDLSIPIYHYRLSESLSANPRPDARLVPLRAELGEAIVSLHAQFLPPHLEYQATLSATIPTGDRIYGLSTGHVTVDLSNHFEHAFAHVTPSLELGIGDSSTLANQLVVRNYTTLGPLAHFQTGMAFPLFWGISFEANAYEQLPIGDQKIYESITRHHTTTTIVAGRSVSEDNGFTTALDIPLEDRTTLSAYYNHSLRLRDDTVGVSMTYVLRNPNAEHKGKKGPSDDLLRSIDQTLDAPALPPALDPKTTPPR
jgi:hypothetical protein